MKPDEIVNLSLSNLIFSYNLHFATFKNEIVQDIHRKSQVLDGTIETFHDFEILTHNNLLSSFQTHTILIYEPLGKHSKKVNRNFKSPTDLLYPIRKFVGELRHAHAHIEDEDLKFIWDSKNKKKEYLFQIQLPITRSAGPVKYAPNSAIKSVFGCQVVPKQEIKLDQTFIMLISILSFHIREICAFQDLSDCDQFLKNFDSSWEEKL